MSRHLATDGFAFVRKTAFGFLTLSDVEVAMGRWLGGGRCLNLWCCASCMDSLDPQVEVGQLAVTMSRSLLVGFWFLYLMHPDPSIIAFPSVFLVLAQWL